MLQYLSLLPPKWGVLSDDLPEYRGSLINLKRKMDRINWVYRIEDK